LFVDKELYFSAGKEFCLGEHDQADLDEHNADKNTNGKQNGTHKSISMIMSSKNGYN
jgi:hypothetical protein